MAKKKNKQIIRPWCWYCEREFEDEKVLMQHQKAKHFKCGMCPRRLNTAGGLAVHIQQVHKLEPENLPRIENALPGRDGYEVEIFGMVGIPAPDVADYKRRKEIELGLSAGSISQPPPKRAKIENRPLSESELKAQLEAHKALMGNSQGAESSAAASTSDASIGAVYGAAPQAYATPPPPMSGGPPPPGFFGAPPPGFPSGGPPPFPPPFMVGFPPGPPPPGFPMPPGFPPGGPAPPFPPAGALPQFPPPPFIPGASATPPIPPLPPRGLPPPQFIPAQQQPTPTSTPQPPVAPPPGGPLALSAVGPLPSAGGPTSSESQGLTTEVRPADPRQGASQLIHPPRQLTLPNPALAQVNPEFKKPTVLKWLDPNFSPEEQRSIHPTYFNFVAISSSEESKGKSLKRARAEDFL